MAGPILHVRNIQVVNAGLVSVYTCLQPKGTQGELSRALLYGVISTGEIKVARERTSNADGEGQKKKKVFWGSEGLAEERRKKLDK